MTLRQEERRADRPVMVDDLQQVDQVDGAPWLDRQRRHASPR
jgi:hypothetical protein